MIKTWQQRCEEHPDHEGIVTEQMIRERMQEEIDELRQALAQPEQEFVGACVTCGAPKGEWLVDAVNISAECVDETVKGEHEPWPSVQCVCGGTIYFKYTPPISDYHEGWEEGFKAAKHKWVGLTADEIWKCNKAETGSAVEFHICSAHQNVLDFAEAIEQQLKEKNECK
jgi:hypothetical protein